jgi:invasion protein IalB
MRFAGAGSMNVLHCHLRLASLLVLTLALGTSWAIAQEAPPAATRTAPAATPAPAGSVWVKVCKKGEQVGDKEVCQVKYEAVNPDTGMVLVGVAVRAAEGEEKQLLLVRVTTAYTLVIPVDLQIKIDDGQPISLKYIACLPQSCQAQTELNSELLQKMRKGNEMTVAAENIQQKTLGFRVALQGFAKAYDGPPVDNALYEESQRRMEQARQMVMQKKEEESEQPQGGVP